MQLAGIGIFWTQMNTDCQGFKLKNNICVYLPAYASHGRRVYENLCPI